MFTVFIYSHKHTVALAQGRHTQISVIRNSPPKKRDTNGHLISRLLPDHNCMGIPVKKRDMTPDLLASYD